MDLDFCLVCEKHTAGGVYCSELCRRVDLARALRSAHDRPVTSSASSSPAFGATTVFPSFQGRRGSTTSSSSSPMYGSPSNSPRNGPSSPPASNTASQMSTTSSQSWSIPALTLGSAALPLGHTSRR
ncbi:hypothetical protein BC828DRAFT_402786 [Blastocladiella britannica]|nr:hypothetical protein BC828DRAFT_402786 [Blastocladiella britannica]